MEGKELDFYSFFFDSAAYTDILGVAALISVYVIDRKVIDQGERSSLSVECLKLATVVYL